jgi:Zn-dependent peptidase ImmA (M78 family)/transcriptional regulator with XRE-family HTH domain
MSATRVPVNAGTLAWARETLGLDENEVARAAGVKVDQYERFEAGLIGPTLSQLRKIAHKLDRPVAFFLAPPPEQPDVPQTADFRSGAAGPIPSLLLREMKRANAQRRAFLELVGAPAEHVRPGPITWDNARSRAAEFREALGLTPAFRPAESQAGAVFNFWRAQLEARGYLVFQTTGVPYGAFRGLSIQHNVLPIILVNGADAANGKTFTLFHEVAHLANRTSGVCLLQDDVNVEALCNAFAAEFLMPAEEVERIISTARPGRTIEAISGQFRVSTLAAAIRLRRLNLIDDAALAEFREQADEEWARNRRLLEQKEGFAPPAKTRARDLGPTYLSAVFEALDSDRLNYLDATYLLNARIPTIEKMLQEFRGGRRRRR